MARSIKKGPYVANHLLKKAEKAQARADKRTARIKALEAKLAALKNPVGTKAIKANKKAGAVTVTKFA